MKLTIYKYKNPADYYGGYAFDIVDEDAQEILATKYIMADAVEFCESLGDYSPNYEEEF